MKKVLKFKNLLSGYEKHHRMSIFLSLSFSSFLKAVFFIGKCSLEGGIVGNEVKKIFCPDPLCFFHGTVKNTGHIIIP